MIKFFRRIRQQLLRENNFTKYLIYAIGEIVLVVIGILIALSINNRSQYNKERDEEVVLLAKLSNEVGLDIKQIENNTEMSVRRLANLDTLLQQLKHPDSIDKRSFVLGAYQFVIDNYFKSNSGVFDEAVSSGKMSYVQNELLRQQIFDYYRTVKESYTDVTTQKVTDDYITPLIVETLFMNIDGFAFTNIDITEIANLEELKINELKDNKDFWKMVLYKFGSNREQMIRWSAMRQRADQLKTAIDEELTNLSDE